MVKTLSEMYHLIDSIDPVAYAKTRNQLSGAVTRLSPYITRGVITLPAVRERLLEKHAPKACEKLIQELAWREYFQEVWWTKGDDIFSDLRFSRDNWRHTELVSAVIDMRTGVEVIDSGVRELYDTGYMHNHLRMWVASVACNLGKAYWHEMGRWLYYHLHDGDLASNFLSWQWVAATSKSAPYTVNQKLINGCSEVNQVRSILTYDRDAMLDQSVPEELEEHESFTLTTPYPDFDPISSVAKQQVVLYTPWTLDPLYKEDETARRIMVIDPAWFDRYPVSESVLHFITQQAQAVIEGVEIYVGSPKDIQELNMATSVFARRHQTTTNWPSCVQFTEVPKLFPEVTGYYKSFFAYWKAVEKSQKKS